MSDPKDIGEGIGPAGGDITDQNIHELDFP
jgi:hypothetical protein